MQNLGCCHRTIGKSDSFDNKMSVFSLKATNNKKYVRQTSRSRFGECCCNCGFRSWGRHLFCRQQRAKPFGSPGNYGFCSGSSFDLRSVRLNLSERSIFMNSSPIKSPPYLQLARVGIFSRSSLLLYQKTGHFSPIKAKMWLQTFFLTLASPSTAMLSWLLPEIIFEGKFFCKNGCFALSRYKLAFVNPQETKA